MVFRDTAPDGTVRLTGALPIIGSEITPPIASEVPYGGSTGLSSTNVESALDELDIEKASVVYVEQLLAEQTPFTLEQSFASPSTVWTIVHGRGTKAISVETWDTNGASIEGDVSYPDDNTVQIVFYHPQAGLARVWN